MPSSSWKPSTIRWCKIATTRFENAKRLEHSCHHRAFQSLKYLNLCQGGRHCENKKRTSLEDPAHTIYADSFPFLLLNKNLPANHHHLRRQPVRLEHSDEGKAASIRSKQNHRQNGARDGNSVSSQVPVPKPWSDPLQSLHFCNILWFAVGRSVQGAKSTRYTRLFIVVWQVDTEFGLELALLHEFPSSPTSDEKLTAVWMC